MARNVTIGVDEVGMGCLAGPVVVCAVRLTGRYNIGDFGVQDSKRMTPKQRETCFANLKNTGIKYQISYCYPKTIDKMNIYQAARKAMRRAVQKILGCRVQGLGARPYTLHPRAVVLVDGPHPIAGLNLPQVPIVKGDSHVFAIACASVLAKVHRDRMMRRYAKRYPQYGFEKHKGYGTPLHKAMLLQHGPCEIHRRSFSLT